jgi:hypothetical protein
MVPINQAHLSLIWSWHYENVFGPEIPMQERLWPAQFFKGLDSHYLFVRQAPQMFKQAITHSYLVASQI